MTDGQIFDRLGEAGIAELVAAFYRRVRSDAVIGPLYPADEIDAAEGRLRDFLVQRFGGPARYSDTRGHPRLRMRHGPFPIDLAARNRWMELMTAAMAERRIPAEAAVAMSKYFSDTATFMMNR